MTGSPGFSRWEACRDRDLLPGTPGPAEAGTPERRCPDECSTFIRRWEACRDRNLLPRTPGPAEAGTPERRCPDEKIQSS